MTVANKTLRAWACDYGIVQEFNPDDAAAMLAAYREELLKPFEALVNHSASWQSVDKGDIRQLIAKLRES